MARMTFYRTRLRTLAAGLALFFLASCGDGNDRNDMELKDPSATHPPSEAIPDSTKLVADSVIMPDTVPNNGKQVGHSDSIHRNQ